MGLAKWFHMSMEPELGLGGAELPSLVSPFRSLCLLQQLLSWPFVGSLMGFCLEMTLQVISKCRIIRVFSHLLLLTAHPVILGLSDGAMLGYLKCSSLNHSQSFWRFQQWITTGSLHRIPRPQHPESRDSKEQGEEYCLGSQTHRC